MGGLPTSTVNGFAVDPSNPKVMYVAMRDGVFRTNDGGWTWAAVPNGPKNVASIAVNRRSRMSSMPPRWTARSSGARMEERSGASGADRRSPCWESHASWTHWLRPRVRSTRSDGWSTSGGAGAGSGVHDAGWPRDPGPGLSWQTGAPRVFHDTVTELPAGGSRQGRALREIQGPRPSGRRHRSAGEA